ncbi:YybH family protein [Pontibacter sp. MBLB2868]|uniref:YybH family protein n=1 Tax=Pontibacter sp. MBLB2868 TaxID=3451555 RepID=UPI003F7557CF
MKRTKTILLAVAFTQLILSCRPQEEQSQEKQPDQQLLTENPDKQIRQVLQDQSECWNRGNLECYMQGYWKSDSLLFIGSRGLTYGWQQTLDNYRKSYPDPSAMGQLTFDLKEMRPLAPDAVLVVGKWHLEREASKGNLEGYFSVIFKKLAAGWKVIADHSS